MVGNIGILTVFALFLPFEQESLSNNSAEVLYTNYVKKLIVNIKNNFFDTIVIFFVYIYITFFMVAYFCHFVTSCLPGEVTKCRNMKNFRYFASTYRSVEVTKCQISIFRHFDFRTYVRSKVTLFHNNVYTK